MALSNVIQFPDSGRDPAPWSDRARTLKASTDHLAEKLRAAWRAMLPEIDEDLLTRGDLADERAQRNLYYGAHETLQQNAARLEGLFAAHWLRLQDEAGRRAGRPKLAEAADDIDDLQLVAYGEVDEDLAVKAIASRLRDGCEDGLFAAGRRLAFLAGCGEEDIDVAKILAEAVRTAIAEADFPPAARLEVLRAIGRHGVRFLAPAIHDANAFLIDHNVLPKLRRNYVRADAGKRRSGEGQDAAASGDVFALLQRLVANAGGSNKVPAAAAASTLAGSRFGLAEPGVSLASMAFAMEAVMTSLNALQRSIPLAAAPTNVLREFRNSDAGRSLGHIDAVTADIVATLFDFIFDDAAIADPIKALIGRIQIPVLKVAMLDKSFFSSKAHPARRLLDGISRAAVRCGPNVGHDDPLYAHVAGLIEHLLGEFNQDTSLFDRLHGELDAFLDGQEAMADAQAAKAAPLVAAEEQRRMAALAADQALTGWLAMSLPEAVSDLLAHEWRTKLVGHYLAGDNEAWTAAVGTIADLVASVQPQPDVRERKKLAARLPMLVKRIHEALYGERLPDSRRLALIDGLFSLHAAVLRGAAPAVVAAAPLPSASAEPELASEVIAHGDTQVDNISLVDAGVPPANEAAYDVAAEVAELKRGDWVEFMDADKGFLRYRLSWVSPQRGILLFTNSQSPRALAIEPAALVVQLRRGDATIVSGEPIFDRAVNRALESLKAA
jgi:hypothetical protein